jgi:ferrous iron transport protein B
MQDHNGATATTSAPRHPTVALVGNPNTGKTTLFNALAGMRQHVGNYPGVTVETKKGHLTFRTQTFDLIDLPGTYSLAPRSPDEMVAVDLILGQQAGEPRPDVVVSIVDASNLERNLYLTTQVLELGVPIVLALNMIDVARAQGLTIDAGKLRQQLGVRVVEIQANKGRGLEGLKEAIAEAVREGQASPGPAFPEAFEREVQTLADVLGSDVSRFLVRRMLLDVGGYTEQRLAHHALRGNGEGARHPTLADLIRSARQRLSEAGCGVPGVEARTRYAWIRSAMAGCVERPAQRPVTMTDRLDRILTHKVWGTLVFLALMFLVFEAIFEGARPLMKAISAGKDWLAALVNQLPPGPFTSLLADGIIEGVGAVVVFLPQIIILFGFIAILEDCGYMARAAFLMDRLMARCGLSGKSFIPMLSSVACAVPGIMATRVIENRRDRLTTILVAPLMSCSARLPVYILLIGAFLPVRSEANPNGYGWWVPGAVMFAMYALGIVVAPLVAFALKRTLLRGETPAFVMEMPMYKTPSPRLILRRMVESGWAFLYRAGTLIFASMVLVWLLLFFPHTDADGVSYFTRVGEMRNRLKEDEVYQETKERVEKLEDENSEDPELDSLKEVVDAREKPLNELESQWKRNSYLGRMGRAIEPIVRPLGWDWKIGTAALASFPAREVVVGTLGILYSEGKVDSEEIRKAKDVSKTGLGGSLISATWDEEPERKVFTIPVALSLMVFFALCCQCASTLAVIRRETRSWRWPAFTFAYMTVLAYIGAFITYQIGTWIQGL